MIKEKKIIAIQDIVIPRGTVFAERKGCTEYISGNFEAYVGTSNDTVLHIVASDDELTGNDKFIEVIE